MTSVICLTWAMAACSDDGPADPGTGAVEVTAVSTGEDLDSDGYVVQVGGTGSLAIGVNATVVLPEVTAGDVEVRLTGVRGNCTVEGVHPRIIRVVAGETFRMSFDVVCSHSPLLGRIVFHSDRDGNLELYSMNPDGSDQVRLTNTPDEQESLAAASPDGTQILFDNWPFPPWIDVGTFEVYVMDAEGTGSVNLSHGPDDNDRTPVWSPDGSRIAFVRQDGDGFGIWVMNADGTEQVSLASNAVTPAWSPDGARILYTAPDEQPGGQLYVINADGSGKGPLTSGPASGRTGAWSPDGTRIAFVSSRTGTPKIYVMNADGSEQVGVTDGSGIDDFPSWSPDGTRIAFQRSGEIETDVFVVNADGTGLVNISNHPGTFEGVGPQAWGP